MKAGLIYLLLFSICIFKSEVNATPDTLWAPGQVIAKFQGNSATIAQSYLQTDNEIIRDSCISLLNGILDNIGVISISTIFYYDPEADTNYFSSEVFSTFVVYYSDTTDSVVGIVNRLSEIGDVVYVHPNYMFEVFSAPDDPKWASGNDGQEKYLTRVKLLEAWQIQKGCKDVRVAVVDVGFRDLDHPDMVDKFTGYQYDAVDLGSSSISAYGYSKSGEDYYTPDYDVTGNNSYHGLECSSIIAANPNNNKGMVGIGWRTEIVPVRVGFSYIGPFPYMTESTGLLMSDFTRGISWIVQTNSVKVVSISVGVLTSPHPSNYPACEAAFAQGIANGITFICATGNRTAWLCYPATSQHTISVGSVQRDNHNRSGFSSYGDSIDIMGIGHEVWVAHNNTFNVYEKFEGTSYAAPMVAAGAALVLSQNPHLNFYQVRDILTRTAEKYSNLLTDVFSTEHGFGLLNLRKALESVPVVQNNIYLTNEVVDSIKIVHAHNLIEASNNFSVVNTAFTEFKAGQYIALLPGFSAIPNSDYYFGEFRAVIGSVGSLCNGGGNRLAAPGNPNEQYEVKMENNFLYELYPNPCSEILCIQNIFSQTHNIESIHIYDLSLNKKLEVYLDPNLNVSNKIDVNVKNFADGIYLIGIGTIDGTKFHKVIIQK